MWKIEKGLEKKITEKLKLEKRGNWEEKEKKISILISDSFFKGFPALNLPFKALFYIKQ